jgi:hypothetical protein
LTLTPWVVNSIRFFFEHGAIIKSMMVHKSENWGRHCRSDVFLLGLLMVFLNVLKIWSLSDHVLLKIFASQKRWESLSRQVLSDFWFERLQEFPVWQFRCFKNLWSLYLRLSILILNSFQGSIGIKNRNLAMHFSIMPMTLSCCTIFQEEDLSSIWLSMFVMSQENKSLLRWGH